MNPAALKTNLPDLKRGGTLIVNREAVAEAADREKMFLVGLSLDDPERHEAVAGDGA